MRVSDWRRTAGAIVVVALTSGICLPAAAQQKDDAESRLRAALRNATIQLRNLQDQNATLQAKQAEVERDRQSLTQRLGAAEQELKQLRQRATTNEEALQQAASRLEQTTGALEAERGNLAKWRTSYEEAAGIARTRDTEVKRLTAALAEMQDCATTAETKNAALYKIGKEVLDLYEKKGFFDVLITNEPVTGLRRVELENLMQDYGDKLLDNRVQRSAR